MNMITVLLGATAILLVVALGLSFGQMNAGVNEDEVKALERQARWQPTAAQ